jgi:glycerol kinase
MASSLATIKSQPLIGAIDQGTSSTRFLVFEQGTGRLVASSQIEIKRLTPCEGWVEIDPNVIMSSVYATMANVHDQLAAQQAAVPGAPGDESRQQLACIGICNQRESTVVWDARSGQPLYNVIVWMDNRTKDIVDQMIDSIPGRDFNRLKDKTGLPMSTYFSAFKLKWLLDNVPEVRAALDEKRLLFGTVDSWILWNLTGRHLTDVTNASRTFLMDIETLRWDKSLCKQFQVPMEILPKILSSADDFGQVRFGPFMGIPITGVIGDQSAALFGHNCLQTGQTKATFGE